MLSLFDFTQYRPYLAAWIESLGTRSYGVKGRMAAALNISSSLVSQILKGEKNLTPEQTSDLCDFLGLNEIESDYLHLLVEYDKAGTPRYREKLKRKINLTQEQSRKIGKRVHREKELTDEQKAIFYSSWIYAAIHNLSAIPGYDHVDAITDYFQLEPQVVNRAIQFLLENGLCIEQKGKITYGPKSTHVDKDSPFVNKHHQNWRIKGLQQMDVKHDKDIFFTSPMSLSEEAAIQIQKMLPDFIQAVMKIVGPSDSEVTACLNIDWYRY